MYAALCLGFIGSVTISWYSCVSSRQVLSQVAAAVVMLLEIALAFVVLLLFAAEARKNIHDQLEDKTPKASMNTWPSLRKVCKEEKRPVFFIIVLLACLAVILSGVSRSSIRFNEMVYSLLTGFQRSVVGIVLPLTVTDLIDSSYEQENEKDNVVVI